MKRLEVMVIIILLTTIPILSQDYQGKGRVAGNVYDEEGNPLEGVKVKLVLQKSGSGFEKLTDSKGRWEANWVRGGMWDIDFEKIGYESKKIARKFLELSRNPLYEVKLKKLKKLEKSDTAYDVKGDLTAGNMLFEEGKYEEALRTYEMIIEKDPKAYMINLNIGHSYFELERYDQAEEYYLKVLEEVPENYDVLLAIGNCYSNRGEENKALEWYNRIEFEKIDDTKVLFNIGRTFYTSSRYNEALKYYKRAVEIQEDFLDAVYQLGLAYLTLGNNQEAITIFENYLKHDSDSERASQVTGFIEFLNKKDENQG